MNTSQKQSEKPSEPVQTQEISSEQVAEPSSVSEQRPAGLPSSSRQKAQGSAGPIFHSSQLKMSDKSSVCLSSRQSDFTFFGSIENPRFSPMENESKENQWSVNANSSRTEKAKYLATDEASSKNGLPQGQESSKTRDSKKNQPVTGKITEIKSSSKMSKERLMTFLDETRRTPTFREQ